MVDQFLNFVFSVLNLEFGKFEDSVMQKIPENKFEKKLLPHGFRTKNIVFLTILADKN